MDRETDHLDEEERQENMKLTDRAEEILEIMWVETVEKEQDTCDATLMRDDGALRELVDSGCVVIEGRKVRLTDDGRAESKSCIRRHRLAERLLVDVLAVKSPLVHDTGCDLEHLLHKGLEESICTLLGHPKTCPHGSAIPEGNCCLEARKSTDKMIVHLSDLEPGDGGIIAYLHTDDKDALQKLLAMGALPGTEVILRQRTPSIVFELGRSQFAIDAELASKIHIRRAMKDAGPEIDEGLAGFGRRCMRRMAGFRRHKHCDGKE
jgi:DtxR family Mn-dependent transcriptional regulator